MKTYKFSYMNLALYSFFFSWIDSFESYFSASFNNAFPARTSVGNTRDGYELWRHSDNMKCNITVRKHKFLCMLYFTLTYHSNHNLLYFLGIPKAQPKAISSSQLVINVLCFFHCLNIALSPFLLLHVLEMEWTISQKTLIKKKVDICNNKKQHAWCVNMRSWNISHVSL